MEPAIRDYAAIGDGRSLALISRRGSVDWLCWPRVDSPSLFGALLDPAAGRFAIRPLGDFRSDWRYEPGTNLLRTAWSDGDRFVEVRDWMPAAEESEKQRMLWPEHALLRQIHCARGPVDVEVEFAPRPGWGVRARRATTADGVRRIEARRGLLQLACDAALPREAERFFLRLRSGETCTFFLGWAEEAPAVLPPPADFARWSWDASCSFWRRWSGRARYDGPWREAVVRSALAVKLLTFAPSGAIVAAGTTSLPERIGGDLNWDYRYCWVRDAALTVRVLLSLGYEAEAHAFASWLLHTTRLTRPEMRVLYDVYGRKPPPEQTLPWRGYRGSRPVRVHNAASDQLQLDAYGEVIDAVAQLGRSGYAFDRETGRMLLDFGRFVCRNWERPDSGIWEPRGAPQHHSHSKVLCWVALERLLELQERGLLRRREAERFAANRALIAEAVRRAAWNETRGSYVQTLGGDTLDAACLLFGWYGFERNESPRMRATAQRLVERLAPRPGLLYRYEQSLDAGEGAFLICSFWLAEHLARGGGGLAEAERIFVRAAGCASDLGLLPEEVDARTGEALGNYPQAFSHIGLISAALAIEERRRSRAR